MQQDDVTILEPAKGYFVSCLNAAQDLFEIRMNKYQMSCQSDWEAGQFRQLGFGLKALRARETEGISRASAGLEQLGRSRSSSQAS